VLAEPRPGFGIPLSLVVVLRVVLIFVHVGDEPEFVSRGFEVVHKVSEEPASDSKVESWAGTWVVAEDSDDFAQILVQQIVRLIEAMTPLQASTLLKLMHSMPCLDFD
jgi:hypothetical protein